MVKALACAFGGCFVQNGFLIVFTRRNPLLEFHFVESGFPIKTTTKKRNYKTVQRKESGISVLMLVKGIKNEFKVSKIEQKFSFTIVGGHTVEFLCKSNNGIDIMSSKISVSVHRKISRGHYEISRVSLRNCIPCVGSFIAYFRYKSGHPADWRERLKRSRRSDFRNA